MNRETLSLHFNNSRAGKNIIKIISADKVKMNNIVFKTSKISTRFKHLLGLMYLITTSVLLLILVF